MDEKSMETTEKLLTKKLPDSFKIEKEVLMKPKIKIVGIDDYLKLEEKTLEEDINIRNFKNCKDKCKILHTYTNEKTKLKSVLVEVSAEIYKNIKDNNDRLFVGHQRCRVFDVINVKPCFNCGRYGHSGFKCMNNSVCLKCAGNHKTRECKSETAKCTNCAYVNKKFNKDLATNHMATDSDKCTILQSKIKRNIEMTDYPIKPTLPSYNGIADNLRKGKRTARSNSMTSMLTTQEVNASSTAKQLENRESPAAFVNRRTMHNNG